MLTILIITITDVHIRHIAGRPKRDISQDAFIFPERMSFSFTLRGKKIRLELKLNKQQTSHVRLQIVTETGISAVTDESIRVRISLSNDR